MSDFATNAPPHKDVADATVRMLCRTSRTLIIVGSLARHSLGISLKYALKLSKK